MLNLLDKMYIGMKIRMNNFLTNEDGAVDIVAIVVLIGVVVMVAIIFRDQLSELVGNLFSKINTNAEQKVTDAAKDPSNKIGGLISWLI